MDSNQYPAPVQALAPIETEGIFGTVVWQVPDMLNSSLPRLQRDTLLQSTLDHTIGRGFDQLVCNILAFMGQGTVNPGTLSTAWSHEVLETDCEHMGKVTWLIPEGVNDALTDDQRVPVLAMVQVTIAHLFHGTIEGLYAQAQAFISRNI